MGFGNFFVILLQLLVSPYAIQLDTSSPNKPALAVGLSEIWEVENLKFAAHVPKGDGPFPVVILLGGIAFTEEMAKIRMYYAMSEFKTRMKNVANTHVLVAAMAEQGSWNVVDEPSTRDDTILIGTNLTDYLARFSNVEPTFKLVGFSNGAGLVNRILIENDDPQIASAVTCSSQLNTQQWHDGDFYIGGSDNAYNTSKPKLTRRRLMQLTGSSDTFIPFTGGVSNLPSKREFLSWTESIFRLAQAYGHVGPEANFLQNDNALTRVSYLRDQVQAYNYQNATHDLKVMFSLDVIEPFLLDTTSS